MQKHTPTYDEALSLLKEFNKSESQLLEHLVQREPRLMDKIKFLQLDFGTWDELAKEQLQKVLQDEMM